MKRSMYLCALLVMFFANASAQQAPRDAVRPSSEQSLQELVTEVRQLRATLQRMNAAVYKGQVLLERLKLQQEQVTRISRDVAQVREEIQELKSVQQRIKEQIPRVQEGVEAGVKHASEIAEMKRELDQLSQREHWSMMRETRLNTELDAERATLNDLNEKLNALVEIEMAPK